MTNNKTIISIISSAGNEVLLLVYYQTPSTGKATKLGRCYRRTQSKFLPTSELHNTECQLYTTCLQMLLLWPHVHQGEENLRREAETYFQGFEASLLFLQGSLLFPLVHFGERHAGVGQGRDRTGEGASS